MYTSTFTLAPGPNNDEFQTSMRALAAAAKSVPGYLGEETWENQESGVICITFYWRTMDALQHMAAYQDQLRAAQPGQAWRQGYQVVVAEVVTFYGDGRIAHPLNDVNGHRNHDGPGAIDY